MDYPGASPEIVESEVTKKVEEAVNTVAGINSLYSRSYEGTSVVIVEFNLDVDGRKAAEDVREKVALIRPLLRDEVKEPRVSRFDPASQPIFNVAVLSARRQAQRAGADDLGHAGAAEAPRERARRRLGAASSAASSARSTSTCKPAALEALGIGVDQVVAAVRSENQELPLGAIRSLEQERVVQINARLKRPGGLPRHRRRAQGGRSAPAAPACRSSCGRWPTSSTARRKWRAWRSTTASARCCSAVQKSQGENTIAVVDGLLQGARRRRGRHAAGHQDRGQPRQLALDPRLGRQPAERTLFEGAALTVLIVFLFLNSWRSTVITGLTLPIALIGTFLFMYVFGFTINSITMMALCLCVGLLIDDAIVVRENIVRHVQMGKSAHQAALDGTNEIGLAVLATTLSIVAVFLPIGFMGGIVGKFFHEFGITIVAAVLISMFVSFTLDPMLSSIWHDPQAHGVHRGARRSRSTTRPIGRVTGLFDRLTLWLSRRLPGDPRLVAAAQAGHAGDRAGDLRRQLLRSSRSSAPSSCPRPTSPRRRSTSTPRSARRSK